MLHIPTWKVMMLHLREKYSECQGFEIRMCSLSLKQVARVTLASQHGRVTVDAEKYHRSLKTRGQMLRTTEPAG